MNPESTPEPTTATVRWAFIDGRVFDFDKREWLPEPPAGFAYDLRSGELIPLSELPGVFHGNGDDE